MLGAGSLKEFENSRLSCSKNTDLFRKFLSVCCQMKFGSKEIHRKFCHPCDEFCPKIKNTTNHLQWPYNKQTPNSLNRLILSCTVDCGIEILEISFAAMCQGLRMGVLGHQTLVTHGIKWTVISKGISIPVPSTQHQVGCVFIVYPHYIAHMCLSIHDFLSVRKRTLSKIQHRYVYSYIRS